MNDVTASPITFIVEHSERESRLDPRFYHPYFLTMIKKLKSTVYPLKVIGDIMKITSGSTPKEWSNENDGILFLKTVNIRAGHLDLNKKYYIPKEIHEKLLKRAQLKTNNVLLTIVGATFEVIGRAAIIPENFQEANINQAIAKLTVLIDLNPFYIEAFLNSSFGQAQIRRAARPVAQINISLREVKNIMIPIPPRKVQDHIASLMQNTYKTREKKLDDSMKLLGSINDYILKKLDIKPGIEHKGPFLVRSRDLTGRFDTDYYLPHYLQFRKQLSDLSIPVMKLENLIQRINYGASLKALKIGEVPFLRIKNLTEYGDITLEDLVYARKEDLRPTNIVEEGDLLISRSGTIGTVALILKKVEGYAFGSFMIRFSLFEESQVNRSYLCHVLNSDIGRLQTKRILTGAIQKNLTIPAVKSILLPIPPLSLQEEIVEEVNRRKSSAALLQLETSLLIEKTYKKVEQMFIGD